MKLGNGIKFTEIATHPECKVYLNNNPVWDFKLTGYILELIAFDSDDDIETVTVEELGDYLLEEGVSIDSVMIVNEETGNDVIDFNIKYKTVFLSNLLLK
jgi:hypothetical protein